MIYGGGFFFFFFFSSFTFIKMLFSSFSFCVIRVVLSVYLGLLLFLPAILIRACASSSLAFYMMYSAYRLNKQGDNIQLWCTPFPIWKQSIVPYSVLTIASCPTHRFLRRQVRWFGIPISTNFPQFVVTHTVKSFGIINKAEVVVFLQFSCFFYDPIHVGCLISGSLPFLNPAWTCRSS